jgi:hypothetical protein
VIGEYLPGLGVFVDGLIEERDRVLGCSFTEDFASRHEAAVVTEDCYAPFLACEAEGALPYAVRMLPLPMSEGSLDSRLG